MPDSDSIYPAHGLPTNQFEMKYARLKSLPSDVILRNPLGGGGIGGATEVDDTLIVPYVLPPATYTTLGGVIVGSGLAVTAEGLLSTTGGGSGDTDDSITYKGDSQTYVPAPFTALEHTFIYLEANTGSCIVEIPAPILFNFETEVLDNPVYTVRGGPNTDPDNFIQAIFVAGGAGTIEGLTTLEVVEHETWQIQSDGVEYKIINHYFEEGPVAEVVHSYMTKYTAVATGMNDYYFGALDNILFFTIFADSVIGPVDIHLPAAAIFSLPAGGTVTDNPTVIVSGTAGSFTKRIDVQGGGTMNGVTLITFVNEETYAFQSDGTEWKIISHSGIGGGLTSVQVDGTTITGDGTVGNPLIATGGGGGGTTYYEIQIASGSTVFTFPSVPASYNDYIMFVHGSAIRPVTDYTTVGNDITIPAVVVGDEVRYQRIK